MNHEFYMNLAFQEALKALDENEVPVGSVIVRGNSVIGRGYNRIERLNDATAHAEILAISAATSSLSTWRLNDCSIYVTIEPCLMCLGAILQSRIERIIYGAHDNRYGAIKTSSFKNLVMESYRRFPEITEGIMGIECKTLIQSFFKKIRKKD